MKRSLLYRILVVLYILAFTFAGIVAIVGWKYYALPLQERPHHALHPFLKPGGLWGHGMGIVGSSMILLLFLYSARKRELFGLRFGRTRSWLNVHIFFGIVGPVLITLHSALKFNGIVSISYFSMLAVMFSGIFGRYIYMQIPRDPSGAALSLEQISSQDRLMTKVLVEQYHISGDSLAYLNRISGAHLAQSHKGLAAMLAILFNDLKRPFLFRQLRRSLYAENRNIPPQAMEKILHIARQKSLMLRRLAFLDSVNRAFYYWHVLHKPFAYVMIIIMFVHVIVALTFGYRWIF